MGVREPLEQVMVMLIVGQIKGTVSPSGRVFRVSWKWPTAKPGRAHSSKIVAFLEETVPYEGYKFRGGWL